MGGKFLSTDPRYQEEFVKGALEGIIEQETSSLEEAKILAEKSKRRVIGIDFHPSAFKLFSVYYI